jgi:hypothetical protein
MKYLDEGQRNALDTLYPYVLEQDRLNLARGWRDAKQSRPELTKEEFVRNDLSWAVAETSRAIIDEHLERLEQGEKLLALSERR